LACSAIGDDLVMQIDQIFYSINIITRKYCFLKLRGNRRVKSTRRQEICIKGCQ